MNRLEQKYNEVVTPSLMKKFNYKSVMEVPHVDKIVINMGIGEAISNPKVLDEAVAELAQITGQAPVITKAKKSIANFKLREGMPIGCKVTLRKEKMYDFLDKLPGVLKPGGKVAILTFHSGEDRLVKKSFKQWKKEGLYSEIAKDVIRPSKEECFRNSRAKCTKMRWAIRAEE